MSVDRLSPKVNERHLQMEKRREKWIDFNLILSTLEEHFQRNETPLQSTEQAKRLIVDQL